MDPFEEFQMKPLTKGLGFHKKQTSIKNVTEETGFSTMQMPKSIPAAPPPEMLETKREFDHGGSTYEDLLESLSNPASEAKESKMRIQDSLQKASFVESAPRAATPSLEPRFEPALEPEINIPMDKIKTPFDSSIDPVKESDIFPLSHKISKQTNDGVGVSRGAADSPFVKLRAAGFSVPSAFLDLVVVTAFAMVFLVSLLMITKVSLATVFSNSADDRMTQLSLVLIYVAVFQMYSIISRTFFGKTLGEWTFEYQLGRDEDQKTWSYPLKVVWRSILITCTGIIPFPLMSLLLGTDLAAPLTGLRLFKKSY